MNFPFGTNGKFIILGVPILKHIRVYACNFLIIHMHIQTQLQACADKNAEPIKYKVYHMNAPLLCRCTMKCHFYNEILNKISAEWGNIHPLGFLVRKEILHYLNLVSN